MKYIAFITLFVLLFIPNAAALAQTNTPTPNPNSTPVASESADEERIQRIKDLVASRVAELNLVEKRGILGTVKDSDNTQVTITDNDGETRIIDIDELTKFESDDDDEEFGISDIEEGDALSFIGLYNKETKRLLARVVSRPASIPSYIEGVISEINEDDFQIIVVDTQGKSHTVDIERSTDTQVYEKGSGAESAGFSDMEVGRRTLVVGFPDTEDEKVLNASRILYFADVPPSPEMRATSGLDEEIPVSTGSGSSVEPLGR